ncbi:MAG: ThiF family adenylyltransferase [Phenylobacterium sp.]
MDGGKVGMAGMIKIVKDDFKRLKTALLSDSSVEQGAVLFASHCLVNGCNIFLVKEIQPIPDQDMVFKHAVARKLKASGLMKLTQKALEEGLSLIIAHSHPGSLSTFSGTDDQNEKEMMPRLLMITDNNVPHGTLVMNSNGRVDARFWGPYSKSPQPIDWINIVGRPMINLPTLSNESYPERINIDLFDRQVKMFGSEGQKLLSETKVTIIGAGGTGSVVGIQLAYLGVEKLFLIDHDIVDYSNLNRLLGATKKDIGRNKIDVLSDAILNINPQAKIEKSLEKISEKNDPPVHLIDSCIIFLCTDNMSSRVIVNDLSLRFLIPVIDVGVGIQADKGRVSAAGGSIYLSVPGELCLQCLNRINPDMLYQEIMAAENHIGYVLGEKVESPAVISLNSTVASQAVNIFIDLVTGCLGSKTDQIKCFDMIQGNIYTPSLPEDFDCRYCKKLKGIGHGYYSLSNIGQK